MVVLEARNISKFFRIYGSGSEFRFFLIQYAGVRFYHLENPVAESQHCCIYFLRWINRIWRRTLHRRESICAGKKKELAAVRNEQIGFVFQFHYLLNEFFCPSKCDVTRTKTGSISWRRNQAQSVWKIKILRDTRLKNQINFQAGKTTQSIARALINDPLIIMGDEPTR